MNNIIIIGNNNNKKSIYNVLKKNDILDDNNCFYNLENKLFNIIIFPKLNLFVNNKLLDSNINISLIINYITLENFKKDLYLTCQLREKYNIPILLVFDKVKNNLSFDFNILCNILKCDLFFFDCNNNNIYAFKKKIDIILSKKMNVIYNLDYYDDVFNSIIYKFSNSLNIKSNSNVIYSEILNSLEGDCFSIDFLKKYGINFFFMKKVFFCVVGEQLDVYIAKLRYKYVNNILRLSKNHCSNSYLSNVLDKIFLNRIFGLPIFFFIIYLMFIFSINVGGIFKDFIDFFCQALFIEGSRELLYSYNISNIVISIISDGLLAGLSIVLSFIPVLMFMFLFLAFLENSGYIPRATFLIDKLMRLIGLPGKSFVPMIIGFGCNVPAILSTRTFSNKSERILTIIMTPFISCNARLAIYTVFVSVFYGNNGGNVIFLLYLMGVLVAVLTGLVIKNFFFNDESKLIIEFFNYKMPSFGILFKYSLINLKKFILKSGKIIIPISIFISIFSCLEKNSNFLYVETFCKKAVVLFKPIGLQDDNWPALVGLASGIIAKEVIIGTLDALYRSELRYLNKNDDDISNLFLFKKIFGDIHFNISSIYKAFENYSNFISNNYIDKDVSKIMYKKFGGPTEAFAYLLFVLLYFPCLPVIVVIYKELNIYWAYFSIFWCTFISYSVSLIFYQTINFFNNFFYSFICLLLVFVLFFILFYFLKLCFNKYLY